MRHFAAAFGLLALVRQQGLLLLLGLLVLGYLVQQGKRRQRLRLAALAVAAACCVVLPWTVRNYLVHKRFVLIDTHGGSTMFLCNHPHGSNAAKKQIRAAIRDELDDAKENDHFYSLVRDHIKEQPWDYFFSFMPRKIVREVGNLFQLHERGDRHPPHAKIYVPWFGNRLLIKWVHVLPFLLIGVVAGFRRERGVYLLYLLAFIQVLLMVVLVVGYPRYRLHNLPFYMVFAAVGLSWLYRKVAWGVDWLRSRSPASWQLRRVRGTRSQGRRKRKR